MWLQHKTARTTTQNSNAWIQRPTTVRAFEKTEPLLRRYCQKPSYVRQARRAERNAQKQAPCLTEGPPERDTSSRLSGTLIVTREAPASTLAAPGVLLSSDKLIGHDSVAGLLAQLKRALRELVLETFFANEKSICTYFSTVLERLAFYTLHEVVSALRCISRIFNAVLDKDVFIAPMTPVVDWEPQKLVAEQTEITDMFWELLHVEPTMDSHSVRKYSNGSDQATTNRFEKDTNEQVQVAQHSHSVFS